MLLSCTHTPSTTLLEPLQSRFPSHSGTHAIHLIAGQPTDHILSCGYYLVNAASTDFHQGDHCALSSGFYFRGNDDVLHTIHQTKDNPTEGTIQNVWNWT